MSAAIAANNAEEALRAAIKAADFQSVRGSFKFGPNQFPVPNYGQDCKMK